MEKSVFVKWLAWIIGIPLALICGFILAAQVAFGFVSFDSFTTSSAHQAVMTFSHTVGTGENKILLYAENGHASMPINTVSWNGDAMTSLISTSSQGVITKIWYILNPDEGTHNLVATSANADHWHDGTAVSYFGVDQTSFLNATGTSPYLVSSETYTGYITTTVDNAQIFWALYNGSNSAMTGGANTHKISQHSLANPLGIFDSQSAITPAQRTSLTLTSAAQAYLHGILIALAPYVDTSTPPSGTTTTSTASSTDNWTSQEKHILIVGVLIVGFVVGFDLLRRYFSPRV